MGEATMDHMSALDASFLYIENEFNHMHIAVVAIFEGPAPQGGEIEEMIASKLPLVPRYRQKVRFVPFDLGRPVWSDDHHFNLRYHVRHTALPAPGSDEQLRTLVGRVMSQQLDRAKPLWEAWVVEGLEGDRWAILSKTHHCMVDGVSGSDLLSVLLDSAADADHPIIDNWRPESRPTGLELLGESFRDGIKTPGEVVRNFRSALAAPGRVLHQLADAVVGFSTFREFNVAPAETSLNGPIGPHRRWYSASTSLDDILKIRSAHGGTVNDVVLSVITQGFRALMLSRGEAVDGLCVRSLVPVSVRREDEHGTLNNRVAAMFADLPVGIADPLDRLRAVRAEMEDLKEHHQSAATETLGSISDMTPTALLALGARIFAGLEQHSVQTVTTNVPGPRHTLYAAGCRMLNAYPYVPLSGSVRIGVAIFSYAGHLTFGVTGDYESAADIDVLAEGIEAGVQDLLGLS
jgi:diacylglycerol O-acyltransferase